MNDPQTPPLDPATPIVATAGSYFRNTRYLMSMICIGLGLWFGYDGFINWPKQNQRIDEIKNKLDELNRSAVADKDAQVRALVDELPKLGNNGQKRTELDLRVQRGLGVVLPPLGVLLLAWWIYKSRGEIRLERDQLTAPGHAPIVLSQIQSLDKKQWERKGIAWAIYDVPGQLPAKLKLDDFVYQAQPIHQIVERIEQTLKLNG